MGGSSEAGTTPERDLDRWIQQVRKGSTQLAILQLVCEQDRYGYEVVRELESRTDGVLAVAEGNVYPTLHQLEEDGYLTSYWQEVEAGVPPRKYYRPTEQGERLHERMVEAWETHARAIEALISGGDDA